MSTLTTEQIRWLNGAETGLGPWDPDDATDLEVLADIRDDIAIVIGIGHDEDVSWITTEILADYITHHCIGSTV